MLGLEHDHELETEQGSLPSATTRRSIVAPPRRRGTSAASGSPAEPRHGVGDEVARRDGLGGEVAREDVVDRRGGALVPARDPRRSRGPARHARGSTRSVVARAVSLVIARTDDPSPYLAW